MKNIVCMVIGVILAIGAVVGSILCGVNVLQQIFEGAGTTGGSWVAAATGFGLAIGCGFVGKVVLGMIEN